MAKTKPILCLDFDGVLHSYTSGWQGAHVISDPPVRGAMKALCEYTEHFTVYVHSSRSHQAGGIDAMRKWLLDNLQKHTLTKYRTLREALDAADRVHDALKFPEHKPPASVSLDDRGLTFTGEWPSTELLLNFKPWYK